MPARGGSSCCSTLTGRGCLREVEFTAVPLSMLPHTALCDSETLTN